MARAYTLATAALTLGVPSKWLDNVLSHYRVPGVDQERQGVSRRVSVGGLVVLGLTLVLMQELGLATVRAVGVAGELAKSDGRYRTHLLSITIDLSSFRAELLGKLERAVEIAPLPKRGRPPASKTGRLD